MKKLLCIISLLITFGIHNVHAEVKDTCKAKPVKLNLKPQISNKLLDCFLKTEFYSLAPYCDGYVEFGFIRDTLMYDDSGTEYKALSNLEDFFRGMNYSRFKIMSGINSHGEDVFVVKILFSDVTDDLSIDVYFTINKQQAIYSIIVIL